MAPKTEAKTNENTEATGTEATAPKSGRNTAAATAAPRIEPEVIGVNSTLTMPEPPKSGRRSNESAYPFGSLKVGESFGVKNKTAEQLSSAVSLANKKARTNKLDENGNVVMKTKPGTDANGNAIQVPTDTPETVEGKRFFVVACEPSKDPEGALARVWRQA